MSSRGQDDNLGDDEIEIELRPVDDVAARMVILAAMIRRAVLDLPDDEEEDDEYDDEADFPEGEQFDIVTALDSNALAAHVTGAERRQIMQPVGDLGEAESLAAFWQIESLAALAWATGLLQKLPEPWIQVESARLLAAIPAPWEEIRQFRESLALRDDETVALQRERAEIWLWRATVDAELKDARGAERTELEAIIRETVGEAKSAGLLPRGGRDFPVGETDFAMADPETRALITEISTRRLHALNWLCGFGGDWDTVPLDI